MALPNTYTFPQMYDVGNIEKLSEFITTYVLSFAINYHFDDEESILIDYKGGGPASAFQKRDIKLPHLVGNITNIDKVRLQRFLASIQSKLRI